MTLPKRAEVVVIGGGAMGTATGYYLTKNGIKDVVLLERESLLSGSTGRCAGGFRQQFPTRPECQLAKESIDIIKTLQEELDYDFERCFGGYLVLSYTEEHAADAKKKIAMQQELGIPVVWKTPDQIGVMAPWLNRDEGFVGAAWCPTDGTLNPFKFVFAFAEAFKRNGGQIYTHTPVVDIKKNGTGWRVITPEGEIECEVLVNCTGAYSAAIGKMIDHPIPVVGLAREKIITEPVKFFQTFLCNSPLHTLHFSQTKHGSFLMSCANMSIKQRGDFKNTWRFTQETADAVRRLVPCLAKVKILRQWAGFYETTPDGKPFIGKIDGQENYWQTLGYNGHGMMLAPAAGRAVADEIAGKPVPEWYDTFKMSRVEK